MSKQQSKLIPEKIHLTNVHIFKASLETSKGFLDSPVKVQSFSVDVGHEIAHNFDDGKSRIRLFITVDGLDTGKGHPIGLKVDYGIEFHFHIENFQDFIHSTESEGTKIALELGATLLGLAFSTSRGIVLERTQGTYFEGVILPVIDPIKMLLNGSKA